MSDLIKTYSLDAVNQASLTVLGYPAVMITYSGERYQVLQKLRGQDPNYRPVVNRPAPKPLTQTSPSQNTQPQRMVARSLF